MNETHCFFDFQTSQTHFGRPDPERLPFGWLLVTDPTQLTPCEHENACLLSLKIPAEHPMLLRGEAGGFKEALHFFENLAADRISARLPDRLTRYWDNPNKCEAAKANEFTLERIHFGDQFQLEAPRLGLEGFLTKNRNPFNNTTTAKAAARQAAAWIKRVLANSDETSPVNRVE